MTRTSAGEYPSNVDDDAFANSTHFTAADRQESTSTIGESFSRNKSAARSDPPGFTDASVKSSSINATPLAAADASSSAIASDATRRAPSADPPHEAHSSASALSVRCLRRTSAESSGTRPEHGSCVAMDAASAGGTRVASRYIPLLPPVSTAHTSTSGALPPPASMVTTPPRVFPLPSRASSSPFLPGA